MTDNGEEKEVGVEIFQSELSLKIYSARRVLELKKTDDGAWVLIVQQKSGWDGRELPREAVVIAGEELRAICAHGQIFQDGVS